MTTEQLLDYLIKWFRKFCVVNEDAYYILAFWVMHTYVARELKVTPRLLLASIMENAGKTTILEHLKRLCRGGDLLMDGTPAAIARAYDTGGNITLLLDEGDKIFDGRPSDVSQLLLRIINNGYRTESATRMISRREGPDWETHDQDIYGPLALAANFENGLHLKNDVLSRFLRIDCVPTEPNAEYDAEKHGDSVRKVVRHLTKWASTVSEEIAGSHVTLPPDCRIRMKEKWRSLMRIAKLAGPEYEEKCYQLVLKDLERKQYEAEHRTRALSKPLQLIRDLQMVWEEDDTPDFLPTSDLLTRLNILANSEKDSRRYPKVDPENPGISSQQLGRLINGAIPDARSSRYKQQRGFWRSDFETSWEQYSSVYAHTTTRHDSSSVDTNTEKLSEK